MQKVTYTNAYGESLVFGQSFPILLSSVSGLSRPDADIVSVRGAWQDGVQMQRIQMPERNVQVQFDILPHENREALYKRRLEAERILASGRAMKGEKIGLLTYENDAGKWQTDAVPAGAIAYGKRFQNALPGCKVRFFCPNPYLLSAQEQTSRMHMGQDGLTLPTTMPIRLGARKFYANLMNTGTADTPVKIIIYGTGESPRLVNHTTGAEIVIERAIANGERLIVDTDHRNLSCVLEKANGEKEDAFGYLSASAAMSAFVLVPGSNQVEYIPSRVSIGSRVEIFWHSLFEGV